MNEWTEYHEVAKILKDSVYGVGPIIAAGLVAYFDVHKANTAGGFWRYAGLDPSVSWSKGEKRPWNASLKTLCWKMGDCFMKFSNALDANGNPACFYGQLYRKKKLELVDLNESGKLFKTAEDTLSKKKFKDPKTLSTYNSGKCSDGHVDGMARRWAVKLFLSNLHELWCAAEGIPVAKPYSMAILGHTHYICQPEILTAINNFKSIHKANGTDWAWNSTDKRWIKVS
jgi:hypothetical protein